MWEICKHKKVKAKRKLCNMDQVTDIVKLNKFDLLKKEIKEFAQES